MRPRRLRLGLLGVAATACVAGTAALALGQDVVPIKISAVARVTPDKAGAPAHPQGVKLDVRSRIDIPSDYDPPLVNTVDVWISKGGLYNGAKYPTCGYAAMARRGLAACPKGSIMGAGSAKARADTVFTYPRITVVNGGPTKVYFYTVLTVPARVAEPVTGTITKVSGRWSYKLHVTIPRNLQIVAGIPLRLDSLHIAAGRGSWLATIGCPAGHRWPYHAEAAFDSGQLVKYDGSVRCRR